MSGSSIKRLEICLRRHIQFFEGLIYQYENFLQNTDSLAEEDVFQAIRRNEEELVAMQQESQLLLDELKNAQLSESDYAVIRDLSQHAEELSRQVFSLIQVLTKKVDASANEVKEWLSNLRLAQKTIHDYFRGGEISRIHFDEVT